MEIILAITIGVLYSTGFYLLLRRSIVKLVLGVLFLSNATNLLVFVSGGLTEGAPVFIDPKADINPETLSDPLPQALVLTAIVIGLGLSAFFLVLKYKYHEVTGTEDLDEAKETEDL